MFNKFSSLYRKHSTDMSDLCLSVAFASGVAGILLPSISGFQSGWGAGGAMFVIGAFYFVLGLCNIRWKTAQPKLYDDRFRKIQLDSSLHAHHFDAPSAKTDRGAVYSSREELELASSEPVEV